MNHLSCLPILAFILFEVKGHAEIHYAEGVSPYGRVDDTTELSALDKMAGVTSVEEFLELLTIHGRKLTHKDIFSEYESESRQMVIAGGGRMAVPDSCSPRNTTINIQAHNPDTTSVYYPRCTTIERCGGCTSCKHLSCEPSYKERVSLNVIKAEVPFPGSPHLVLTGFENILLERHLSCRLQCNLSPDKCGPNKRFLPYQCDCACLKYERCEARKVWNPEQCSCECAKTVQCCCGLVFSQETCQCEVDRKLVDAGNANNISTADIMEYILQQQKKLHQQSKLDNSPRGSSNSDYKVLTSGSKSSMLASEVRNSPPLATTRPRPSNACFKIRCPPRFVQLADSTGRCLCRPTGRRRGRASRRGYRGRRYRSF